jgi:hypothetical protein
MIDKAVTYCGKTNPLNYSFGKLGSSLFFYNRFSFFLSVDKIAFLFPHLGLWSVETKIDYDGIKTKEWKFKPRLSFLLSFA